MYQESLESWVSFVKGQMHIDEDYGRLLKMKTDAYQAIENLLNEVDHVGQEAARPLIEQMVSRERELALQLAITRRLKRKV